MAVPDSRPCDVVVDPFGNDDLGARRQGDEPDFSSLRPSAYKGSLHREPALEPVLRVVPGEVPRDARQLGAVELDLHIVPSVAADHAILQKLTPAEKE